MKDRTRSEGGGPPPARPGYKWGVVGMLWLICAFNYADRQVIFSVFPKLRDEFGFDPVQLGLIGSAFMWTYAFGAPLAGFIADHLRRRTLILGGCLFWSAITGLTGICGRFWQFAAVRALEGLGETVYFPASLSLMSDYHGPATRSRALSIHQSGVYVGTIAGSGLGAWFAMRHGWRAAFYFFGAAGAVLSLVLFRFLRETPRGAADQGGRAAAGPRPRPGEALRMVFSRPMAWILMLMFMGANFVAAIFLTWIPTFLVEKFGFRLTEAGLSAGIFIHLPSAISVPFAGWMADRFSRRLAGGRVLVQAAGLLAGASFVALVGLTGSVHVLLLSMTLFGLCKGVYDANIWAALYDFIEPRARGSASGIMNTVGWAGGALGPVFVGLATKYGRHARPVDNMGEAIAAGAAVYLACGLVLLAAAFWRAPRDAMCAAHP